MYADALVQVRMEAPLKMDVNAILDQIGIDASTVIRMLYKKIRALGRIPFDIGLSDKERTMIAARQAMDRILEDNIKKDRPEMTMEEIDAEIAAYRAERKARAAV